MSPKKRRTFLTNAQKLQLKQFWSEHPDLQLLAVVDWVRERFGVSVGRATLYRIYHTPASAFAGNAQQKKGRRVKFPQLERDVLAFYEESRRLNEGSGAVLSDDALLRAAAELRVRHGISESELKLSNGWLHRFKERHALRVIPRATGEDNAPLQAMADNVMAGTEAVGMEAEATQVGAAKPKRKPRVPPRNKVVNNSIFHVLVAEEGDAGATTAPDQATLVSTTVSTMNAQAFPIPGSDTSRAFEDTAERATATLPVTFQPLTYVTAIAVGSVAAVAFVRWQLNSGMAQTEHFAVENDGVLILKSANYQLNVELQHSMLPAGASFVIFKVWAGVELLGQCGCSVLVEGGRALSLLQLQCALPAQTVVRVEYHAPGVVYSGSRLVLRLLNESHHENL
ncbi:hypothetical protein KRP22_008177 [Phytophthora ramorum]|nr:hypothetical protein KRP22_3812 [Phytophthora ramorum]